MDKRSTATNLSCFTQNVANVQGQADVIYTDFSKVFIKMNHLDKNF